MAAKENGGQLCRWLKCQRWVPLWKREISCAGLNTRVKVKKGEPLAEIDIDEVTIEMEAVTNGVVRRILVREGEAVPIGTVIALLEEADEPLPDSNTPLLRPAESSVSSPVEGNQARASQGVAPGRQKGILLFCLLTLLLTFGVSSIKELWPLTILAGIAAVLLMWILMPVVRR